MYITIIISWYLIRKLMKITIISKQHDVILQSTEDKIGSMM